MFSSVWRGGGVKEVLPPPLSSLRGGGVITPQPMKISLHKNRRRKNPNPDICNFSSKKQRKSVKNLIHPGLCSSNKGRLLKVYKMNILDKF